MGEEILTFGNIEIGRREKHPPYGGSQASLPPPFSIAVNAKVRWLRLRVKKN